MSVVVERPRTRFFTKKQEEVEHIPSPAERRREEEKLTNGYGHYTDPNDIIKAIEFLLATPHTSSRRVTIVTVDGMMLPECRIKKHEKLEREGEVRYGLQVDSCGYVQWVATHYMTSPAVGTPPIILELCIGPKTKL